MFRSGSCVTLKADVTFGATLPSSSLLPLGDACIHHQVIDGRSLDAKASGHRGKRSGGSCRGASFAGPPLSANTKSRRTSTSTRRQATRRGRINPVYHEKSEVALDSTLYGMGRARMSTRKNELRRRGWKSLTRTASHRTRLNLLRKKIFTTTRSRSRHSVCDFLVATTANGRHARASGSPRRPPRDVRDWVIPAHSAGKLVPNPFSFD
jgi:hypothetical protein